MLTNKKVPIDRDDKNKVVFLSLSLFFIIGSYSILRPLKMSIFLGFVGKEFLPYTRYISIILITPCLMAYAALVDAMKRHHVVYIMLGIYASLSIIFSLLFLHPVIGIQNTSTSPYRLVGWAFDIFMDLYSALLITAFWGFINTVCSIDFARKHYGCIVAFSRVGGMVAPVIAFLFMQKSNVQSYFSIPFLVFIGGVLLVCAIMSTMVLIKKVPKGNMQGYQATSQKQCPKSAKWFEGLKIMLKEPYVFGIFCMVFSIEVISTILDFRWQSLLAIATKNNIGEISSIMLMHTALFQCLGFFFAFFLTPFVLQRLSMRLSLLIMPAIVIILVATFLLHPTLPTVFVTFALLRAFHYGFNLPIREILYIPTIRAVQLKSKSWINSFGKTLSKTSGSSITLMSMHSSFHFDLYFSMLISGLYFFVVVFMGRHYSHIVKTNTIIGEEKK